MKAILITSSILILLIAALRPLLRGRIDPRIQYALWLAVALRLLIPGNLFTSAYSALALLERADRGPGIAETIGQIPIPTRTYGSAWDQALREFEQENGPITVIAESRGLYAYEQVDYRAQTLFLSGPTLAELAAKCARPLWLGGAAAMALWFGAVNWKLRRRLRGAQRIEADCPLPVYVTDALPSPCLCGALRPRIYVTPAALDGPDRLRHVLAHELTHYRHKDHWWALVRCACLCLYWFDPLVWWAAALSRQDCELACDEGAIRALGEAERIPYGRTLVGLIAAGRTPLLQTATTMTGGKRRVRERVKLIARRPKTVIAVALALALIVGCAVGCTFSGAPEGGKPMSATADSLQARLQDIPEDLKGDVISHPWPSMPVGLADYWLDGAADWDSDSAMGWLVSVRQWDQAQFENWIYNDEPGNFQVFARDSKSYYAFMRPTGVEYDLEDAERYAAAQQAIWAFAEKTVLETEGVEPYTPAQPADTLQARLRNLPAELQSDVVLREVDIPLDGSTVFAVSYWMKLSEEEWDVGAGHLANVYLWSERQFHSAFYEGDHSGMTCFARTDDHYYFVITQPTSAAYPRDTGPERYQELFDAVPEFVRETVLAAQGVEPFDPDALTPAQADIKSVTDAIANAPSLTMALSVTRDDGTGAGYIRRDVTDYDSYWVRRLNTLATDFEWEAFTDHIPDELLQSMQQDSALTISVPNGGPALILHQRDDVIWASHGDGKGTTLYQASPHNPNETLGTHPFLWPGPYGKLRGWFDEVDIAALRAPSAFIPDDGRSHEDIARAWAEGWESAMAKTAPGGRYTCTYVDVRDVRVETDWPENMRRSSAQRIGQAAEDFGKTWFPFGYQTVFVPENGNARNELLAGSTEEYAGDGAPEGAYTYGRVGYMILTDQGWTCREVGTGW